MNTYMGSKKLLKLAVNIVQYFYLNWTVNKLIVPVIYFKILCKYNKNKSIYSLFEG